MTPCQIGMNGRVGLSETPAPCSIVDVSWATVRLGARLCNAGTYGEMPPAPRSPWHCAQANWTKACAPTATCGDTAAGVGAEVELNAPDAVDRWSRPA